MYPVVGNGLSLRYSSTVLRLLASRLHTAPRPHGARPPYGVPLLHGAPRLHGAPLLHGATPLHGAMAPRTRSNYIPCMLVASADSQHSIEKLCARTCFASTVDMPCVMSTHTNAGMFLHQLHFIYAIDSGRIQSGLPLTASRFCLRALLFALLQLLLMLCACLHEFRRATS